jgi:diguanylate cyclase (GGDEF)-like protein
MEFYRERIMYTLAIAILVFVTPFAILNFVQGNIFLALGFSAVVITFVIDGLAIHLKKKPPIPFAVLVWPGVFTVVLSLVTEGIPGAWGCFPAVPLCFFILPRRIAVVTSLFMVVAGTVALSYTDDLNMALRFGAALSLNVVVIYFITSVILGLQNDLIGQAITDPLTGAFNRRQMEFALDESMARNQRTGAPVSVLMIDIDHFKRINDDLGHEAGDSVLKGLVTLIKIRTRKLDRLFRMGGEEFLLLLPDTPGASAVKQAENLRLRIAEAHLLKQRPITVSIGVAEYRNGLSQNAWIKTADDALYRAKSEGRNRVIFGETIVTAPTDETEPESDERRGRPR